MKQSNSLKLLKLIVSFDCLRTVGLSLLMFFAAFQFYNYGVPVEALNKNIRFSISNDKQALILIIYTLCLSIAYFTTAILIVAGKNKAIIAFVFIRIISISFNFLLFPTQLISATILGISANVFYICALLLFYRTQNKLSLSPIIIAIPFIIAFSLIYINSDINNYKKKMISQNNKHNGYELSFREEILSKLSNNMETALFDDAFYDATSITKIDICQAYANYYRRIGVTNDDICSPLASNIFYRKNCNTFDTIYSPKYIYPKDKDVLDDLHICEEQGSKRWEKWGNGVTSKQSDDN